MANLSNFPAEIDTFIEHQDVTFNDKTDMNRYQDLNLKPELTPEEQIEVNNLFNKLREKLYIAFDFNKMQDGITNLQLFFRNNVENYINNLKNETEQYFINFKSGNENSFESWFTTIKNRLQGDIATQLLTQIMDLEVVVDSLDRRLTISSFNFDNLASLSQFKYTMNNLTSSISETIINKNNNRMIADRSTILNLDDTMTVVETYYNTDGITILRKSSTIITIIDDTITEETI